MDSNLIDTTLSLFRSRMQRSIQHPLSTGSLEMLASQHGRPLRVAVARFDGIGDWILTLPLLLALEHSPAVSEITIVAPASWHSLLEKHGRFAYRDYEFGTILQPPSPGGVVGKVKATSFVVGNRAIDLGHSWKNDFDVILLARWDTDLGQNARLWAAATDAHLIGFDPRDVPGTTPLERREVTLLNGVVSGTRPDVHELQHLQTMMSFLGLDDSIPPEFGRAYFGIPHTPVRTCVVLHPLSNEPKRQWPIENWRILIRQLLDTTSFDVEIVGALSEKSVLETLLPHGEERVRLQVGLPLQELPTTIGSARAFIGNDSGPAHIAGSLGMPVVVISPHPRTGDPTHRNSPVRFAPATPQLAVLQPEHGLGKCIDGCKARTPHCIRQIRPDEVLDALEQLLTRS